MNKRTVQKTHTVSGAAVRLLMLMTLFWAMAWKAYGGETVFSEDFTISEISDELFLKMNGSSWKEECPVPREDLRLLHVLHKDAEGNTLEGEMIVHVRIAEDVLQILQELYEADYPIEKMRLVEEYDAEDELSMEDNNTSAFNFRYIPRSGKISKHGLGLAVDINPLYNPYIRYADGTRYLEPLTAEVWLDREAEFPYKIEEDDLCCRLFKEHGFEWGGDWINLKDYQHFEVPDEVMAEWGM